MANSYHRPDQKRIQALKDAANKLRILSIKCTNASNSGHPTSCCSAAEIMSVLFFNTMRYKVSFPRDPSSDRFIMSKGHCAPILYAAWQLAGLFSESELMNLRKIDSDLEGHPTPRLNFIDVATGSLGQGLGVACGMAYSGKYFDNASYRVYCLMGDGETAEGSIWEAVAFASHYKLDNLVGIVDVNRLGQSEPTSLQHNLEAYRKRFDGFGWNAVIVDGNDIEELCRAMHEANTVKGRPTCLIAKTLKGKGIPNIEDEENWHGKALGAKADEAIAAISSLISDSQLPQPQPVIDDAPGVNINEITLSEPPNYKLGDKVATRVAYGTALAKLGKSNDRVIALDGDTKNSTFAITFKKAHPERYIECYIAEQNLVGVAVGCATRDRHVAFVSTFGAFFSRAFDQIRMGAISQTKVNFCGSHAGISIGEDGPSQMALEDLAMFRTIPGGVVFYPSDAVSCERAIELAANYNGITFTRSSRPATAVLYGNDEIFEIGKAKVVVKSDNDAVTVVGAGVTLHEAISAANTLKGEGINIRVVDIFTLKPIDGDTILSSAKATNGKIITVEDHYYEGGLGEAVAGVASGERDITIRRLAVNAIPRSGPGSVLMQKFGIDSTAIVRAVKEMIA
ncbi:Transketolase [Trichoplax sp. H2]|uniref:Transketolase n=1 Tax=Trichoplax adhaerens TaxID=10228 RepID=B3S0U4_TRIAD|nr:expressed hypothetical protein [Trichoplax adhaerens]EDV24065.1 expressed hypothetical protein [Trichoplax adhaerens]RDD44278.1 Transketolase [Trichoplax sp. H2]|eukprot:XP_002113591.1 expressed hypothetical protein [Trichoplax adhaerens]